MRHAVAILAILSSLLFGVSSVSQASEHPVPLPKDADAAKCAECHEDKTKGQHVHSAIAMGCTSCHEIKNEGESTSVELTQPSDQLCFSCHPNAATEEDTQHGPYKAGKCVMCHDPHTGDNEKQLIATGNDLCLECHIYRGRAARHVKLFNKFDQTDDEYEAIPKIELSPDLKHGHPFPAHAVAGVPDYNFPGTQMSCRSCHEYHVAHNEQFTRGSVVKGKDICNSCHDQSELASRTKKASAAEVPQNPAVPQDSRSRR